MELTRRGYAVFGIVVVAELFALTFGARSLNAVAAPGVIALVGAYLQVRRSDRPSADRSPVSAGFPGDTRRVRVDLSGEGVARATEVVPDGIEADDPTAEMTLPGELTYEVTFDRRGEHTLGPVRVRVTDVLGLVAEHHRVGSGQRVLVYPSVYQLAGQQVFQQALDVTELERREFDSLREYAPGDPLRDVHWKSSAKDPDEIYVKEFADRRAEHDLSIAATGDRGRGDEMAAAAASLAVAALDAGLGVELHVPADSVPMGRGESHRRRLLELLARTDEGTLPEVTREEADVRVHAGPDGVEIRFGSEVHTLDAMTVSRDNPLAARGVTAEP